MTQFARWMRFNAVSAAGVAVQAASFMLLIRLTVPYLVATALAVEAAVLHNFFWHWRWTWADRSVAGSCAPALLRFQFSTGAVSVIGNLLLMRLLVGSINLGPLPATAVSIAACSLLNFYVTDRIVFLRNATR